MSGHSKWSKVKHQKATTDVVKGRAFTRAARAISIAVREGGGVADPNHNVRLRFAIEKAREVNVPRENILRAIEKGMGVGGAIIEQLTYECYGPSGVAVIIEAATDNRQRTVSVVKNYVENAGGVFASPGSVSYLFTRCGYVACEKASLNPDELFETLVSFGANDIVDIGEGMIAYYSVPSFHGSLENIQANGIPVRSHGIIMKPNTIIQISEDDKERVMEFIEGIEGLEDIQAVYTNSDVET